MKGFLIFACTIAGIFAQTTTTGPCAGQTFGCYVPDPTNCSFYYHCVSSGAQRLPCPEGLHFNANLSVCDWPLRANCDGNGGPGGPVTELPTGDCPSATVASTHPISSDCTQYIYCYQGYPYNVQCDANKFYSQRDQGCIAASSCPQNTNSGNIPVNPNPGNLNCSGTGGPTSAPYPGDNTKYYYCYNGTPLVVQCQNNQQYNSATQACA